MENISIQKNKVTYYNGTFTVSGKNVKFATKYSLLNEDTGKSVVFELVESTGSEWDPYTMWVYESEDFQLFVLNDDVTPQHAENYLNHKLKY